MRSSNYQFMIILLTLCILCQCQYYSTHDQIRKNDKGLYSRVYPSNEKIFNEYGTITINPYLNEHYRKQNIDKIAHPIPKKNSDSLCSNGFSWLLLHCYFTPQFYGINKYKDYQNTPQPPSTFSVNNQLNKIKRSFDGSQNNERNPSWGAAGSPLARLGRNSYIDGRSIPINYLPEPRVISNQIGSLNGHYEKNQQKITMAFTIWGQFIDHDLGLTEQAKIQPMSISIPPNDKFFKKNYQIPFTRSKTYSNQRSSTRFNRNQVTSWIDASNLYGSDQKTASEIRLFSGGLIKYSSSGLLPKNGKYFVSGDKRVNQNIILTSYHTLFSREHNRLCAIIGRENKHFSDQQIFQTAKNYVIGLLQKITIDDFLPSLLGSQIFNYYLGEYRGYQDTVDPIIPTQFSTAAFRIGHPLLVTRYPLLNENMRTYKTLYLKDMFSNPEIVDKKLIAELFRGLSTTFAKERSNSVIDDVRNFLIQGQKTFFFDLFSLNIQRGRDHGLPLYNEARRAFGLKTYNTFQEFLQGKDLILIEKFKKLYNTPDYMDLWVGIISEPKVKGAILGQLGGNIVGYTFSNIRNGDRYWYENCFPNQTIRQIKQTKLSDIIKRNFDNMENISEDIFHIK